MVYNKAIQLGDTDACTLASEAVMLLVEKLAEDVKLFDVRGITSVTDFYVNVTGRSLTHVAALADNLSDSFSDRGRDPLRIEGKRGNAWILVDYGDVIVNIFDRDSRGFYNFDRLLPAEAELATEHLIKAVDDKYDISKTND